MIHKKLDAIWMLQSQIESLWATGDFQKVIPVPEEPQARQKRRKEVDDRIAGRDKGVADRYRSKLIEIYGPDKAKEIKYAEAFELCEYGR
ncbi:MAG TPA: hypothetical protein PLT20_11185, partial [Sedimentisphaerales bacterium]|nr:hypothetical protein [Sedimentisphaerales bacterium]